jgi:uncharacterized protein YrrD
MLRSVTSLKGSVINATDGEIGHVEEAFFDDEAWAVRYLVVDTGSWLTSRKVLISPYSVTQPLGSGRVIDVALTREQVKQSPDIDTHEPVSRRHEHDYLSYYGYPAYWTGDSLWSMGAYPLVPMLAPSAEDAERRVRAEAEAAPQEDVHLQSTAKVSGYHVQASDDGIGHVEDFVFDEESWAIRYLVIDTRNWWPGGTRVLVATRWIDRIEWAGRKVYTTLTRDAVKASPEYRESAAIDREFETRLHDAHGRQGYWD